MTDDDVTVLAQVLRRRGTVLVDLGRVYYYRGNFYFPITDENPGQIRGAVRRWLRKNRARVDADRAHPDYVPYAEILARDAAHAQDPA